MFEYLEGFDGIVNWRNLGRVFLDNYWEKRGFLRVEVSLFSFRCGEFSSNLRFCG